MGNSALAVGKQHEEKCACFFRILTIEILDEFYSTLWLKSFFPYLRGHKKIYHQIVVEQRHLLLGIWMFLQSAHLQIFSPMSGQQTSQYPLQIHKPFSNWQCSRLNKNLKNNYFFMLLRYHTIYILSCWHIQLFSPV